MTDRTTLKVTSKAPKWVSFGKKTSGAPVVNTKDFRANEVIQRNKNESEEATAAATEFERQRKEQIEAAKEAATKKVFAAPQIEAPLKGPEEARVFAVKEPKERPKGRGRRGRDEEDEDVPPEHRAPVSRATLFDFISKTGNVPDAPETSSRPVVEQRAPEERRHQGFQNKQDFQPRNDRRNERNDRAPHGQKPNDNPRRGPPQRDDRRDPKQPRPDNRTGAPNTRREQYQNKPDARPNQPNRRPEAGQPTPGRSSGPPRDHQRQDRPKIEYTPKRDTQQNFVEPSRPSGPQRDNPRQDRPKTEYTPKRDNQQNFAPPRQATSDGGAVFTRTFRPSRGEREPTNQAMQRTGHGLDVQMHTLQLSDRAPAPRRAAAPLWKNGEQCLAPWEDGMLYPATIVSLRGPEEAVVRYDAYGNTATLPTGVLVKH
ncbi:unnamed protein product, partial [Mesorhabditis spiculigera]